MKPSFTPIHFRLASESLFSTRTQARKAQTLLKMTKKLRMRQHIPNVNVRRVARNIFVVFYFVPVFVIVFLQSQGFLC